MKKLFGLLSSVVLLALMLTGCGEPRFDTSSEAAFGRSAEKVLTYAKENLSMEDFNNFTLIMQMGTIKGIGYFEGKSAGDLLQEVKNAGGMEAWVENILR